MSIHEPIIQCDEALYGEIIIILQDALCDENIYYGDTLTKLVERLCPDLYEMCEEEGFRFIPSSDPEDLTKSPPEFWFDVIKISEPN